MNTIRRTYPNITKLNADIKAAKAFGLTVEVHLKGAWESDNGELYFAYENGVTVTPKRTRFLVEAGTECFFAVHPVDASGSQIVGIFTDPE